MCWSPSHTFRLEAGAGQFPEAGTGKPAGAYDLPRTVRNETR